MARPNSPSAGSRSILAAPAAGRLRGSRFAARCLSLATAAALILLLAPASAQDSCFFRIGTGSAAGT